MGFPKELVPDCVRLRMVRHRERKSSPDGAWRGFRRHLLRNLSASRFRRRRPHVQPCEAEHSRERRVVGRGPGCSGSKGRLRAARRSPVGRAAGAGEGLYLPSVRAAPLDRPSQQPLLPPRTEACSAGIAGLEMCPWGRAEPAGGRQVVSEDWRESSWSSNSGVSFQPPTAFLQPSPCLGADAIAPTPPAVRLVCEARKRLPAVFLGRVRV